MAGYFSSNIWHVSSGGLGIKTSAWKSWKKTQKVTLFLLTLKRLMGPIWPYGFSKNVFSREKVKPCFFVTFLMLIVTYIFSENFIEIS